MKSNKKYIINHYGDWKHHPYSNYLYENGIKPGLDIDKDQDGIVDWEDCNPYNYYEQGLWSSIKSTVSKVVSKVTGGSSSSSSSSGSSSSGTTGGAGSSVSSSSSSKSSSSSSSSGSSSRSSGSSSSSGSPIQVAFDRVSRGKSAVSNPLEENSSSSPSSSSSGGGGTYYAGSKTYHPPEGSGQGPMSVHQIPKGAKVVSGRDPNIPSSISIRQMSTKTSDVGISQQTQDKINQYQQMQNQYYQKQLQQEVSKISNWNQLSNTIKQKYYERWNKKYNKTVNTYANELIKKDLEKQHPGYEVKEVRTSSGITYKFIPKLPTREEGLEEGGAVFLTKDEVKFDGEVKEGALGSMVSPGQRTVHYAEYLMGMEPGSSEVVALGDYTKTKLDDEGGYTLIGRDGSRIYVDKSGKKTPIYSGGASPVLQPKEVESSRMFYTQFYNPKKYEEWKELRKQKGYKEWEKEGLTSLNIALLAVPGWSTKIALLANAKKINSLTDKKVPNETKIANLRDIAISVGTGALVGGAFGAGTKVTKDVATVKGMKILSNVLREGGSKGSVIARNIAGLGVVGTGKALSFGINTYFKTQMIGAGVDTINAMLKKDWERASLSGAEIGGNIVGFGIGGRATGRVVDIWGFGKGERVGATPDKGPVKTQPSAIQSETLTSGKEVYGYRRGPIQTGLKFEPRYDVWDVPVETKTKQTFFRFDETKGVKEGKIQPAVSVPSFVQPPKYKDMFLNNLKQAKGNVINKIIEAFYKTPVITDVVAVGKFKTKELPQALRERVIREHATKGELSKSTQKELLKYDTRISDKLREYKFYEEQEIVFRNALKLKNTDFGWTRDIRGKIIPVIYEKGTLKPRLSVLLKKRIITEQDAKYIQRQYNMWKKYGEKYILPKEHGVSHGKEVATNVEMLMLKYPEYKQYFIDKYGSYEKAVEVMKKTGKFHDIGKTSESSLEFGTSHGEKVWNVWKEGLLPKEIQSLPKSAVKSIKTHETLDPRKTTYKIKDIFGKITPEQKIISTADRLTLTRYGMKVDPKRLPLKDALSRMNVELNKVKTPQQKIRVIESSLNYLRNRYDNLKFEFQYAPTTKKKNEYRAEGKKIQSYYNKLDKLRNSYYKLTERQQELGRGSYKSPQEYPTYLTETTYPTYPKTTTRKYPSYPSRPSYPAFPGVPTTTTTTTPGMFTQSKKQPKRRVRKDLGPGYYVLVKPPKQKKFQILNKDYPLEKSRAKDVGAYYVSNKLARTFKIQKANKPAIKPNYQYLSVPEGFYESIKTQYRPYKIKKGKAIKPYQQFIQKKEFSLSSVAERQQIQQFRKQQEMLDKSFKNMEKQINT